MWEEIQDMEGEIFDISRDDDDDNDVFGVEIFHNSHRECGRRLDTYETMFNMFTV